MTKSKNIFMLVKVVVLMSLLGLVASCVKAQKQTSGPSNGSPRVFTFARSGTTVDLTGWASDQITSQNIQVTRVAFTGVISDQANYGDRREYNLSMCGLSDLRMSSNKLYGQRFEIISELPIYAKPDGGNIGRVTGDDCVHWTTMIPFDPFAGSVNLYVNFIFKTVGGAKTYIHRTVIFNPWDQQRGSNPEFFDFTNFGLSKETSSLPLAISQDEIYQALSGEGKFSGTNRKLEIGSVNIMPVKKDYKTGTYTLPADSTEARSFIVGNSIGDLTNKDFKRIHDMRRSALSANSTSPEVQNLQTVDLNLNMRLSDLKIRLKDSAGVVSSQSDMPLPTGQYKIHAQLVASDLEENGKYYIISSRIPYNGSETGGHLPQMTAPAQTLWNTQTMGVNAVIPLSIVARPMWGNINLVLKVEPVSIPLEPFEAVYNLGTFEAIGQGKSPIFDLANFNRDARGNISFSFDNYLAGATNHTEWIAGHPEDGIKSDSIERGFRRFRFTHLDVLFSRIVPGDTSTDRTIQYTVKTCLQETIFGSRPQGGRKFDVVTEDRGIKTKITHTTDDQGCLSWVGLISHKFYQRERLIEKYSVLTYLGEDGQRQEQTLKYYINPWDEKFTFGRDARVLPEYYIKQINDGQMFAPPTRLLITDFKYDAIGFRYVVDKYMNLTVKKTVLLDLKPKVLKYNSIIWGRSGFGDVRDGIYLLKVAMQKDYLDPAAPGRRIEVDANGKYTIPYNDHDSKTRRVFITVKEVLVRVLGGHIVTPIEFDINDLRTLRLRSQMFIQLETIDEMLLRAVMMVDNRLTQDMSSSTDVTLEIRDRQMTDDQLALEITRLMNQARALADAKDVRDKILELQNQRSANYNQLRQLLSGVDHTVARGLFADIERLGRDAGQTAESVQGNLRYQALNRYIEVINKIVREYQRESLNPDFVRTRKIEASYAEDRRAECKATALRLEQRGETELAARYTPGIRNSLCETTIDPSQMFYFLTSRSDLGSERWLSEVLTADEIAVLKNSLFPGHSGAINSEIINVMRDDFTEAYRPDYDFNLLSNQGDEMAEGADKNFTSGLARRTFMGPVTFVLNGNGSAVRPTDVLDEASCGRTCEQLPSQEIKDIELDLLVASETVQSTLSTVRNFGSDVNEAYEKNPYFGYVGQFYKKQVNDLIPMYRGVQKIYREEMEAFSKDGYFVDSLLLSHVRLSNPNVDSLKSVDQLCFAAWKNDIEKIYEQWRDLSRTTALNINIPTIPQRCFKQTRRTIAPNAFLQKFNAQIPESLGNYFSYPTRRYDYANNQVTAEELKEFSKNSVRSEILSLATKEKILHHICFIMKESVAPKGAKVKEILSGRSEDSPGSANAILGNNYSALLFDRLSEMENECHGHVDSYIRSVRSAGNLRAKEQAILMSDMVKHLPFVVERRVRVLDTTDRYVYQDGKTLNYSVSASFSIGGGFSTGRGRKYEFDADKMLGGAGAAVTGAAVGFALGGPVGAAIGVAAPLLIGGGASLLGFNIEWRESEGMGVDNGTSVSKGTTLAAQISTLDIELKEFEKCIIIRPSTEVLLETKKRIDGGRLLNGSIAQDFQAYQFMNDFTNMGYFVCSGDIQTKDDLNPGNELRVRERYYYFTQIFNDGDMQDPGELVNHPWMLMLRGQRDYAVFDQALQIPETQLIWGEARDQRNNDISEFVTGNVDSNNRISGATLHDMPSFNVPGDFEVVSKDDTTKALDMMQEGFERALPAVPGMYTFSDYESDGVSSWPQQTQRRAPAPATPARRTTRSNAQ